MKTAAAFAIAVLPTLFLLSAAGPGNVDAQLARHRNLGKAFYENPTTQNEAVVEFQKALALAPKSARERLNYGLALLRAGKTAAGMAQLTRVQQQDPSIPHTWFNLGIAYKKAGDQVKAIQQFERMVQLEPDDAISHYNLGALYRLEGRTDDAIRHFNNAARLDPTLAAPHFQLFNLLRSSGRGDDAKLQLEKFQELKKQQEGAAIPEDVEWNMFAEIYDVPPESPSADAPAALRFVSRSSPAGPTGVAGDANNDGVADYCVIDGSGGRLQPGNVALASGKFSDCVWIDFDHDYDLDVMLLGEQSVLLRNQGPAGFQPASFPFVESAALAGSVLRVIPDTKGFDLIVTYANQDAVLYRDLLQGNYKAEKIALPAGARRLVAADLNNDSWLDLGYVSEGGVFLSWNRKGRLEAGKRIASAATFALADLENRGVLDVVTAGGVLRNDRKEGFIAKRATGLSPDCADLKALDADSDGRMDLACGGTQFLNRTTSGNTWIGITLEGVRNGKLAFGSEVEVKSGRLYQKKIYEGQRLAFGLGKSTQLDTVRITWPNGLIQNEMKQLSSRNHKYVEAQRLSGSCPIIWTWNGREFEYITDVLGVAPLGASAGDGVYFPVDHDEYIQIPGSSLKPVNGEYRVRITEELSEVAYLDKVQLIAVDHPKDVSIYTSDKFKGPPFPEFRLYGARSRISPVSAVTSDGRNVLEKVLAKDGRYPDDFSRNMSGVAGEHALELDFGSTKADNGVLILSGWVDWADGSTFLGVAQHGRGGLVPPYLQMKDAKGKWKTVIEDMGMPAGKPKTIAVDLSGKWLSDSRAVRIVTNLCVYWDEVFLAPDAKQPRAEMKPAAMRSAMLRFRGFSPATIHPERKQPERFSYAGAKPTSLWNPTPGMYTRYGNVRELMTTVDDKMTVMGSGDEVTLTFEELPPPAEGWTRDFLLLVDGWAKDRDANTAHGQSTEPLPFHKMSKFPYGSDERFPDDEEHRNYLRDYQTRPALKLIRPLTLGDEVSGLRERPVH